jgi:predicted DsbA family dithiol-disulfide isomerase
VQRVTLIAWSDYLCPWCYNASVRLRRLEDAFGEQLRVEWRSYLLRPQAGGRRDLERFRAYTASWERPAAEPDGGVFRPWAGDAGPPSHSVPAHRLAKAAARISDRAFRAMHERLLSAYFSESRDISDVVTQRELWREVELPEAAFAERDDPEIVNQILAEHREAQQGGATGVPAVRLAGNDAIVVGAHPYELYERWVTRILERGLPGADA